MTATAPRCARSAGITRAARRRCGHAARPGCGCTPRSSSHWDNRSLTAFGDEPIEEVAHRYDLVMIDHPSAAPRRRRRRCARWTTCSRPSCSRPSPLTRSVRAMRRTASTAGNGRSRPTRPVRSPRCATTCSAAGRRRRRGTTCVHSPALVPGRSPCRSPPRRRCAPFSRCVRTPGAGRRGSRAARRRQRRARRVELLDRAVSPRAARGARLGAAGRARPPRRRDESGVRPPRLRLRDVRARRLRAAPLPVPRTSPRRVPGRSARSSAAPVSRSRQRAGIPSEAAAFAAFASGAEAQRAFVGPAGGQPGSRTAWHAPELDQRCERLLLRHLGDHRAGVGASARSLVARLPARGRAPAQPQSRRRHRGRHAARGARLPLPGLPRKDRLAERVGWPPTSGRTLPAFPRGGSMGEGNPRRARRSRPSDAEARTRTRPRLARRGSGPERWPTAWCLRSSAARTRPRAGSTGTPGTTPMRRTTAAPIRDPGPSPISAMRPL